MVGSNPIGPTMKAILFDFSRTLLFPKDKNYLGGLNDLNKQLSANPGYNALDHFEINLELLEIAKNTNKDLYMFTSESIQERPEFAQYLTVFKKIYSAKLLGLSKKDSATYIQIAKDIGLAPNELTYIDDNGDNIQAAKEAGLLIVQYLNNQQAREMLTSL